MVNAQTSLSHDGREHKTKAMFSNGHNLEYVIDHIGAAPSRG